jgi:hypothetical protein
MPETIKVLVQLWGKNIKEREGKQNNKQEMQKTREKYVCYVNKKNEEECKKRRGRLRKITERKQKNKIIKKEKTNLNLRLSPR